MTLFAHRFVSLTDDAGGNIPGRYDEDRQLRLDAEGNPVAGRPTAAGPSTTRGELDDAAVIGPTVTQSDLDPDRWMLGPIRTASDLDDDRYVH